MEKPDDKEVKRITDLVLWRVFWAVLLFMGGLWYVGAVLEEYRNYFPETNNAIYEQSWE